MAERTPKSNGSSGGEARKVLHQKVIEALKQVSAMKAREKPIEIPVVIVTNRPPDVAPLPGLSPTIVSGPGPAGEAASRLPQQFRWQVTLQVKPGAAGHKEAFGFVKTLASAPSVISIEPAPGLSPDLYYSIPEIQARRNPPDGVADVPHDGTGVIVGVVDFGFDFAHPNFVNGSGSSRTLAIWDQNPSGAPYPPIDDFKPIATPRRWYGERNAGDLYTSSHVYFRNDNTRSVAGFPATVTPFLDDRVALPDPYDGYYDPHANYYLDDAPKDVAAHGTHIADIAAGNGRSRAGRPGVAPKADIVFVQVRKPDLADWKINAADVLNGIHFIFALANKLRKPAVVNLSMNYYAGPHDGSGPWEATLDNLVADEDLGDGSGGKLPPMVVVSAGNAYGRNQHACVALEPSSSEEEVIRWTMRKNDQTDNLLTIWYAAAIGGDKMNVVVRNNKFIKASTNQNGKTGENEAAVTIYDKNATANNIGTIETRWRIGDKRAIRIRLKSLTNSDNVPAKATVNIALKWNDATVANKRCHAWVERDDLRGQGKWQSVIAGPGRDEGSLAKDEWQTLGDFACGTRIIAVGAYGVLTDPATNEIRERPLLDASSAGPPVSYTTLDDPNDLTAGFGSGQPLLIAPGVAISAARSKGGRFIDPDPTRPHSSPRYPISVVMSGTSMASPHVAGAVAILLHKNMAALGSAKGYQDVRNAIQAGTAAAGPYDERSGFGRLNVVLAHASLV